MPQKKKQESQQKKTIVPDLEKLASLIEFAAAAGHEINNPLAVILGRTQLLLHREKEEAQRQSLETIAGQALRIRDMIGDVMLFADPPAPNFELCNLAEIMAPLVEKICKQLQKKTSFPIPQVTLNVPSQLKIFADHDQFQTVISELLRNALHPSTEATQVTVAACKDAACKDQNKNQFVEISICDDGRELTAQEAEHLFDPFFSGRQAGRGLGFGLCKAWRFVTMHNGSILLEQDKTSQSVCVKTCWPTSMPNCSNQEILPQN